jgi:hypothetical protein
MWTPPGLGCNMDPEQQVMQQHFTGPIPPYQFQQTSHKMMPLEQTTINITPSTSNNKNNTQDEPEIRTTPGNRQRRGKDLINTQKQQWKKIPFSESYVNTRSHSCIELKHYAYSGFIS